MTIAILGWWLLNIYWIESDSLIRDGDEEGHVGAMELFKEYGLEKWLIEMWSGHYGEYPSLFAGIMGGWWRFITNFNGVTPPDSLWIRGVLPLTVLLTAVACARIAWRQGWNWQLTGWWVLCTPLLNGVGRHFMLESMMTMWVCITIMFCSEAMARWTWWKSLGIGFFAGCSLLTKQTCILTLGPIILLFFVQTRSQWKYWVVAILGCLVVAGPWYFEEFFEQVTYLSNSAESKRDTSWITHTFVYPIRVLFDLGNIWIILLCVIKPVRVPKWIWVWISSLLILMVIPKQYPRLMLAWLPVLGIILGSFELSKGLQRTSFAVAISMLLFHSFHPWQSSLQEIYASNIQSTIDDGCSQQWIRTANKEDGSLKRIRQSIQDTQAESLAIIGDPTVPCSIQSTYNWRNHLEPYLRRRGIEVLIYDLKIEDKSTDKWQQAHIQIEWKGETILSHLDIHIPNQ